MQSAAAVAAYRRAMCVISLLLSIAIRREKNHKLLNQDCQPLVIIFKNDSNGIHTRSDRSRIIYEPQAHAHIQYKSAE